MPSPATHHRHDGDGWVECTFGGAAHRHWGLYGAAGLLLARGAPGGTTTDAALAWDLVLQHRALWSHHGGTWGIPGGALAAGEDAVAGALRESTEEAGIAAGQVRVVGRHVLDHGVWRYTTVLAVAADGADVVPAVTDPESLAVQWVPAQGVDRLPLHPAFAAALPGLLSALDDVRRTRSPS
ncbi:NUDIX hydrolase [Xylanimonas cellulosilytica DSM 15894]|uniref:NUDIX hydrolase n=1 Tax=Xylanimonas cellulosilytica (strain DSM 15894 / JCM 12276 / CECT 5975 / KCTC 9989 / LMG 20990 / NBRC 107835 / XIL07) TaxID=446471 RepID=D1BYW6_XYLCX|nr:NUDIX hydrolase [Xylanimonas cellulosilytica]ACZ30041.1 NUDIX hydrolase [Xylanimonas cellulosilytica DSM 15894]